MGKGPGFRWILGFRGDGLGLLKIFSDLQTPAHHVAWTSEHKATVRQKTTTQRKRKLSKTSMHAKWFHHVKQVKGV